MTKIVTKWAGPDAIRVSIGDKDLILTIGEFLNLTNNCDEFVKYYNDWFFNKTPVTNNRNSHEDTI